MANEEVPGMNAPGPDLRALEERIQRLEYDFAVLRRQVEETPRPPAAEGRVRREAAASMPPPPPPVQTAGASQWSTPDFARLQWKSDLPAEQFPVERAHESLESRLGSQYFNRIAIVLLLIGTAYGMKLAVDRGLIGPGPRVILGLLAGAALVIWSESFRRKGFAAFSYSLKAVGSGVLYLALWAGFRLYDLVPATVALLLMVLVTAWNAYMAWVQDAELLAVYALAGGFATPMLLSTGGNHEIFLFTYLLAIDVATAVLVRLRHWPRLLLGAFPLTVLYFFGWYSEYFRWADAFGVTSLFVALFAAVFGSVPLWPAAAEEAAGAVSRAGAQRMQALEQILLPLANSAFVALAYYSVLQDSNRHDWLPWMMIALAAVYLVVIQLPQSAVASAIHLSISVVLLTIAIPLKASGHWITVSWLVEGLALTWVATRLPVGEESTDYAARTLRWMAMGSLLLGFCGVCFHIMDTVGSESLPFLNKGTGTALTGIGIFAAAAWLAMRVAAERPDEDGEVWAGPARLAVLLVPITGLLLTFRELASFLASTHAPFQTAEFFTALLGLAVFAAVIGVSLRSAATYPLDPFWKTCAAMVTIAFNMVAVLTGVREVSALFAPAQNVWSADLALQQALAISGFLMLYGAALLAAGFWKRSGFLRWQALALLVFTILKAFVYDMRNLSQGYRVVSLLGLGALLLAVSFAYQKDWLNLKGAGAVQGEHDVR